MLLMDRDPAREETYSMMSICDAFRGRRQLFSRKAKYLKRSLLYDSMVFLARPFSTLRWWMN
jgi:hypothetical protein